MSSFLRKNKKDSVNRSVEIPSIGTLHYLTSSDKNFWMGIVDTIAPNNKIELSIEPSNGTELSDEQIKLMEELPIDYGYYIEMLYIYLEVAFEEFPLETIRQMYFLVATELK